MEVVDGGAPPVWAEEVVGGAVPAWAQVGGDGAHAQALEGAEAGVACESPVLVLAAVEAGVACESPALVLEAVGVLDWVCRAELAEAALGKDTILGEELALEEAGCAMLAPGWV